MKMIVGLGNIGAAYLNTPHNIGFMVVDQLGEISSWREANDHKAQIQQLNIAGQDVMLIKPTTMMNASGQAVGKIAQWYKVAPQDIWVVYDELDLPLGRIKISTSGSDNGHNGLISISQRLGHQKFWRFKVGVDTRLNHDLKGLEYVLRPFSDQQTDIVNKSVQHAATALETALEYGLEVAMQRYNKSSAFQPDKPISAE